MVTTEKNGQIQRGEGRNQPPSLISFVERHSAEFARVMPKHLNGERMTRLAISAVRTTRGLAECTLASFASSIMACSVLGLEPNTPLGHAYLIPFKGQCQLIIGYKGLIELMYRSGIVASVKCTPVFDGDTFEYQYGLHPDIIHKPSNSPNRYNAQKLTHVYPVVKLRESGMDPIWDVLSRDQIEQRKKRSASAKSSSSPWTSDYVAMCLKTGVRAVSTWVPSSTEKPQPALAAIAYEEANERNRGAQAIAALGDGAAETLHQLGAFPIEDEAPAEDTGEVPEQPERESGQEG